ncbi:hypothetical protein DPEC_G00311880 [Dallia pectoralis]|uniref:Uncharacterized protein n=1 Tax=Dallia pectoralis TaxID=75939 RepID=A0ACC2FBF0_DALPE|nr:hypothetical protein DPEC_G00311880 [Dallia pectoralis]
MNPGGMRRYNAVRLTLTLTREAAEDGANQGRGTATTATGPAKRPDSPMTRLEFSRAVLQKGMGFVPAELNSLAKPPGPLETFEVSFKNPQLLEKFWKIFNSSRTSPPYNKFKAFPLSDTESKVVTVNFHNECIQEYDIETWLNRYATIKSEGRRVLDEDQVWTGGLKWLVQLKPDPTGVGGVRHLPSTITLGNNRGSVHNYGMPKLCRNCGNLGHLAAACTACKICQGDHLTSDCTTTRPFKEPEQIPTSQSLFLEEDDPAWSQVTHQKRKRPSKRPNQKNTPEPKPQRQKARPNPTPPPSPTPIPSGPLPVPTIAQPSDPIAKHCHNTKFRDPKII